MLYHTIRDKIKENVATTRHRKTTTKFPEQVFLKEIPIQPYQKSNQQRVKQSRAYKISLPFPRHLDKHPIMIRGVGLFNVLVAHHFVPNHMHYCNSREHVH